MKTKKFTFLQRSYLSVICRLASLFVWLINCTTRIHVQGLDILEKEASEGGIIFTFWHNQIFSWSYIARFRAIVVIISRHFDGEYAARMIELLGFRAVRGSSSLGGASALLKLKSQLQQDRDVAFTVDGPRGPIYRVKVGPLWLSGNTGKPIIPVHVEPRNYWSLKSWDRFRIPKPFTRVFVKFGDPLQVPNKSDPQNWMTQFQEGMDKLRTAAENFEWGTFESNWDVSRNSSYRYRK